MENAIPGAAKKPKNQLPVFDKSIMGLAFCFILSLFLFTKATKNKADFKKVKSVVQYIGNVLPYYPGKDSAKFRYLKVQEYERPFELFIGKSTGNF